MVLKRTFSNHPLGWITLGVVALLAVPPVRKALRTATVSTAVGILKLGDSMKDASVKVKQEAQGILTDATEQREEWRRVGAAKEARSWLRKTVVNGVASTLTAADSLTQSAKNIVYKTRPALGLEVGELGGNEEVQQTPESAQAEQPLPERLLPVVGQAQSHPTHHYGKAMPSDFAVRSPQAMLQFADRVDEVGAVFKPEFQRVVKMMRADAENPDTHS